MTINQVLSWRVCPVWSSALNQCAREIDQHLRHNTQKGNNMTDTNDNQDNIARVLRASTRGYSCGTHSMHIGPKHDFGAFVKVPIANAVSGVAIGLIYGVEIKDDLLISELVMAESINPNVLRDQRENRMIPVEISVLNIGYRQENN